MVISDLRGKGKKAEGLGAGIADRKRKAQATRSYNVQFSSISIDNAIHTLSQIGAIVTSTLILFKTGRGRRGICADEMRRGGRTGG